MCSLNRARHSCSHEWHACSPYRRRGHDDGAADVVGPGRDVVARSSADSLERRRGSPTGPGGYRIAKRARTTMRIELADASAAAQAVRHAGWVPFLHFDRAIARDDIEVLGGMTAATSSGCEPTTFNLFVFVGGTFAGTISPIVMGQGRDGVAGVGSRDRRRCPDCRVRALHGEGHRMLPVVSRQSYLPNRASRVTTDARSFRHSHPALIRAGTSIAPWRHRNHVERSRLDEARSAVTKLRPHESHGGNCRCCAKCDKRKADLTSPALRNLRSNQQPDTKRQSRPRRHNCYEYG